MASISPEEVSKLTLVDPAVVASSFQRPSTGGRRSHSSDISAPDGVKVMSVLIARPNRNASWGFLTCGNNFPLCVGEITSPLASRLHKGDEIIEINKMRPEDYEDAIYLFQRARLHLELLVHRKMRKDKDEQQQEQQQPNCRRSLGLPSAATTSAERKGETPTTSAISPLPPQAKTPPPTTTTIGTEAMPPISLEASQVVRKSGEEGGVRYSAQVMLEKLLRAGETTDGNGGDTKDGVASSSSLRDNSSGTFNEDTEKVWSRILSRKRARIFNEPDECNYSEVCNALPKRARQAIYDRRRCPFSAEEGFTSEFHDAVQYIMTKKALSHAREGNSSQGGSVNSTTVAANNSCHHNCRDLEAIIERVKQKVAHRDAEISQYNSSQTVTQQNEELKLTHTAMLAVVASHRRMREEERCKEVERYRKTEHAAQKFLAVYKEATSCRKAAVRGMRGGGERSQQHYHHAAGTHNTQRYKVLSPSLCNTAAAGGFDMTTSPPPPMSCDSSSSFYAKRICHVEGSSSRLMRLPTPPPPPPPPPSS